IRRPAAARPPFHAWPAPCSVKDFEGISVSPETAPTRPTRRTLVHRTHALIPVLAAVLFAAPMAVLETPQAHADRGIRVSGGVRASGHVNVRFGGIRIRPHRRVIVRRYARPRPVHVYTGGAIYWGGGVYYEP